MPERERWQVVLSWLLLHFVKQNTHPGAETFHFSTLHSLTCTAGFSLFISYNSFSPNSIRNFRWKKARTLQTFTTPLGVYAAAPGLLNFMNIFNVSISLAGAVMCPRPFHCSSTKRRKFACKSHRARMEACRPFLHARHVKLVNWHATISIYGRERN